jgi:hypothetical protein
MAVGGEDKRKKYSQDRKMNLREVIIRHDSAQIWGFRYGLTLGIGTLKVMASTGVFVRAIFDLK